MNEKGIHIGAVAVCNFPKKTRKSFYRKCPNGHGSSGNFCSICGAERVYFDEIVTTNLLDFIDESYEDWLHELPIPEFYETGIRYFAGNHPKGTKLSIEKPTELPDIDKFISNFHDAYDEILDKLNVHNVTCKVKFMIVPWHEF